MMFTADLFPDYLCLFLPQFKVYSSRSCKELMFDFDAFSLVNNQKLIGFCKNLFITIFHLILKQRTYYSKGNLFYIMYVHIITQEIKIIYDPNSIG